MLLCGYFLFHDKSLFVNLKNSGVMESVIMYNLRADELLFFDSYPDMLPIYEKLMNWLTDQYSDVSVKVGKTSISLRNKYVFATVSLPWRKVKDWPQRYLLLSIGLSYHKNSPKVRYATEPYPNRWTHHILLETIDEFDEDLKIWLDEAYMFSKSK